VGEEGHLLVQRETALLYAGFWLADLCGHHCAGALLSHQLSDPTATQAPGITTIVLLVLGLGGIQLFSLSIIGDYVGTVLEEAKSRPRFIRSRIFKGTETIASDSEIDLLVGDRRQIALERNKEKINNAREKLKTAQ
jgi:hypothetical protein